MTQERQPTAAHRTALAQMLERLQRQVLPFADTSDEAKAARRGLPFFEWCETYLPHYFTAPPWQAHVAAEAALENERNIPQAHCWSRGAGKSTIFALAKPLQWILSSESATPHSAFETLHHPRRAHRGRGHREERFHRA